MIDIIIIIIITIITIIIKSEISFTTNLPLEHQDIIQMKNSLTQRTMLDCQLPLLLTSDKGTLIQVIFMFSNFKVSVSK